MSTSFDAVAGTYDADSAAMFAPDVLDPAVDFLAELAPGGRALEFAIGTGRVGLPLSRRGVTVRGIELSEPMVDELRAKDAAGTVPVTIGDMATTRVDGEFDLVFLVFNSITNLLEQHEQVRCFRNAAAHLRPGGSFVIEVFVPELRSLQPGRDVLAFDVAPDHLGFDSYDVANQRMVSHHYRIEGDTAFTFQSAHRYAWPAEYDLMAELAGMRLRDRFADWQRSPFTSESTAHVSVWELPG